MIIVPPVLVARGGEGLGKTCCPVSCPTNKHLAKQQWVSCKQSTSARTCFARDILNDAVPGAKRDLQFHVQTLKERGGREKREREEEEKDG